MWRPLEIQYDQIQNGIIQKIIDGSHPALIIKNFYDENSCKTITKRITDISDFDCDSQITKKVGISLLAYITKKSKYFAEENSARQTLEKIFLGLEDPRKKICKLVSNLFPSKYTTIAKEDGKSYSCGIIRIHERGDYALLHRDNAKFDASQFYVGGFDNQLSCVLYLQQPEDGGELLIHNHQWKMSDERFRKIDFGYSDQVISQCHESAKIKPHIGDLIIFNPNHFHEILPVYGDSKRITLGMFLAFSDNCKEVVMWS